MTDNNDTDKNILRVNTIFGQFLTITIEEENEEFISGHDKFGSFIKIPKSDIIKASPFRIDSGGNSN